MGRRVLDRLVEPVAGGVYAADPDDLDIGIVAPGLPAALGRRGSLAAAARELRGGGGRPGSAVASLDGGLSTPRAGAGRGRHRGRRAVRTGVRVTGGRDSAPDSDWRVTTDAGEFRADRVVLALPAPAAARLLPQALPGIATPVLGQPVSPVALVTLVVEDARLDAAPRGTGVLVSVRAPGPGQGTHPRHREVALARAGRPVRAGTCCGCPTVGGRTTGWPVTPSCPASRWPTRPTCWASR